MILSCTKKKVKVLFLVHVCIYVASALARLEPVNNAAVVFGAASKCLSTHASGDHQSVDG